MTPAQLAAASLFGIAVLGGFLVVLGIGAVSLLLALLYSFVDGDENE